MSWSLHKSDEPRFHFHFDSLTYGVRVRSQTWRRMRDIWNTRRSNCVLHMPKIGHPTIQMVSVKEKVDYQPTAY